MKDIDLRVRILHILSSVADLSDKEYVAVVRIGTNCSLDLAWTNNKCRIFSFLGNILK